ncbi:MAG: hypothetical protein AB8B80_03010 [Marinicellaceae bacterium]
MCKKPLAGTTTPEGISQRLFEFETVFPATAGSADKQYSSKSTAFVPLL